MSVPSSSNPGVSNPAGGAPAGEWPETKETLPTGDEAAAGEGPKTEDNPEGLPAGAVDKADTHDVETKETPHAAAAEVPSLTDTDAPSVDPADDEGDEA
jgi:hypothetical protein